ncbi:PH domain-containing protein [Kitasatospora sp. NPDC052868]|uniref:PH domain-containing protein n=1 Tax=Kitasatospora sp. NPDC052868 TaxID=3364060 RepID=UPI0037C66281
MTTPAEFPVTWAPRRTRAVLLPVCALLVVMFAAIAVALPQNWQLNDRIMMALSGALFAAAGLMLARPRVSADADGITVVNFVRSRRLSWEEIVRVNFRQGDPWATLDLADGTSLAAVGIQSGVGKAQAIADARALRDLVESRGRA